MAINGLLMTGLVSVNITKLNTATGVESISAEFILTPDVTIITFRNINVVLVGSPVQEVPEVMSMGDTILNDIAAAKKP
jgi:hypothetical protein